MKKLNAEAQRAVELAVEATKRVLTNVAGSDFCTEYGTNAAYGLREYKEDIAMDIYRVLYGKEPEYGPEADAVQRAIAGSSWKGM